MTKQFLTVTDPYSGETRQFPIERRSVRAAELFRVRNAHGKHLWSYDPGLLHTAIGSSKITYLDGQTGAFLYRGYPVGELAERSCFLETAYLLLRGELPTAASLARWRRNVDKHRNVHEGLKKLLDSFRYDASPLGMLVSGVAAMSTMFPESTEVMDEAVRRRQFRRVIGKLPTLIALIHRSTTGQRFLYPRSDLSYTANFLYMMFATHEEWEPDPVLVSALDALFVIFADHDTTAPTTVVCSAASSQADPYLAVASGLSVLAGRWQLGASDRTNRQLAELKTDDDIRQLLARVAKGEGKLLGYGHRVYQDIDPRAEMVRRVADRVSDHLDNQELLIRARRLEELAAEDPYIQERKLKPNIAFYLEPLLAAIGFPNSILPIIMTIPRSVGWLAHWAEVLDDPEIPMTRPRTVYVGHESRGYVPVRQRSEARAAEVEDEPDVSETI